MYFESLSILSILASYMLPDNIFTDHVGMREGHAFIYVCEFCQRGGVGEEGAPHPSGGKDQMVRRLPGKIRQEGLTGKEGPPDLVCFVAP